MSSLHKVEIAAREMVRVLKSGGSLIAEFKNRLNPFVFLKYKCARYYDATIKKQNLPLTTFTIKEMARLFQTLGCPIKKNIFLGFPHNRFAPIVILEAIKR